MYADGQRGQCGNCGAIAKVVPAYCGRCGQLIRPPAPKSYFLEGMLATALCWPIAGFSIYHAVRVDDLYERGDFEGANHESALAKRYLALSIYAGLAVYLLAIIGVLIWAMIESRPPPDELLMTEIPNPNRLRITSI